MNAMLLQEYCRSLLEGKQQHAQKFYIYLILLDKFYTNISNIEEIVIANVC